MSIRITDSEMWSTTTPHRATLVDGYWSVSWLDGWLLSAEQAEAALDFAEIVTESTPIEPLWRKSVPHLARTIGVHSGWAVKRIRERRCRHERG